MEILMGIGPMLISFMTGPAVAQNSCISVDSIDGELRFKIFILSEIDNPFRIEENKHLGHLTIVLSPRRGGLFC